jgi:hypothetical protein
MSDEMERIWKEAVVTYMKRYSGITPGDGIAELGRKFKGELTRCINYVGLMSV